MLKLGAVDFENGVRVAEKNFGSRFDHTRFSGTGWPKEQHRTNRAVKWIHSSEKYLIETAHAPHGSLLSNNARRQPLFEILSTGTLLVRVQKYCSHSCVKFFYFHFANHGGSPRFYLPHRMRRAFLLYPASCCPIGP